MQAIILATSETEKLRPLTNTVPAPMLPVMNRPVMLFAIELLARQGFKKVIVSLHHLAGSVEAFFGTGQRWNIEIEYLLQKEAWGTAGALKWAETQLQEPFLVLPADTLIDLDIEAVWASHQAKKSIATVVVHPGGKGRALILDNEMQVIMVGDPAHHGQTYHNTGVYIFDPQILNTIPARTPFDIHDHLIPALMDAGFSVYGHPIQNPSKALTTFRDFQDAQWNHASHRDGADESFLSFSAKQVAPEIWVGRNSLIHPSVRLTPPICIGENCFIGQDVELGPNAMIGSQVIIDDGATISNCTILDNTYVGQLVNIRNYIVDKGLIIDADSEDSTQIVDRFLLGEAHFANIENNTQNFLNAITAFFLLLVALPLILPVGIAVLLTSGRLFSRVERLGPKNRIHDELTKFQLLRFRTRSDHGSYLPLGKILERLEWHRLPELWNVFRGDLRLVGVKPLPPEYAESFTEYWQKKRNEYKAGFTGLWYLQTDSQSDLDEVLVTDAYYVATRNWIEDLKLLLRTPSAWLRKVRGIARQ